jgi:hypothetical protein
MRSTNKFTTDGKEIFEGDFIEAKTKNTYPLVIGGQVKFDEENNKWLNLNFFNEDVPHTVFKISEKEYLYKRKDF